MADPKRGLGASASKLRRDPVALGAVTTFGVRIYGALVQYLTQLYLAISIGAEQVGIYAFAWTCATIVSFLTPLGFDTALVRFIPADLAKREWGRVRGMLLLAHRKTIRSSILGAVLGIAIVLIADSGLESSYSRPTIIAFAMVPVLGLLNLYQGIARGFHWITQVAGPGYLVRPTLVIGFAWIAIAWLERPTGEFVVYAAFAASLLTVGLQRIGYQRGLPREVRDASPIVDERLWLRTALPMMLVASFELMVANTDILMVGLLRTEAETGVYNIAVRTSSCLLFVLFAVTSFAAPKIASLYTQNDRAALLEFAQKARLWILVPTTLGAAALAAGGTALFSLFGPEFESAYAPTLILACGVIVRALAGPADSLLAMTGKERQLAGALGIATVMNLILNVILIPRFGGVGAAVATTISVTAEVVMISILAGRHIGFRPFLLTPTS